MTESHHQVTKTQITGYEFKPRIAQFTQINKNLVSSSPQLISAALRRLGSFGVGGSTAKVPRGFGFVWILRVTADKRRLTRIITYAVGSFGFLRGTADTR